jgi:hypothetical protein
MFNRIVNIVFICLLAFCGLWLLVADEVIDSLRVKLDAEKARQEVLNRQKNDLEKALVRTRVQLNSLIGASSDLNDKMEELQKQIKLQELEILRLKKTDSQSLRSSKAGIDSISARISEVKSMLKSSKLEGEKQRDSIFFLIEYSKLLSERVE